MTDKSHRSQLPRYASVLAGKSAEDILAWAAQAFAGEVAFASSLGLEDQVITDMICRRKLAIPIFTLDTGRLFNETYELIARSEERYGIRIGIYFPEREDVEKLVSERGVNGFYDSVANRRECCRVRKLVPLRRALHGLGGWICGLRREQSDGRGEVGGVEWDAGNGLVKINPLVDWSFARVRAYVAANCVPYSPLQDQGYASVGCACCTRAIGPGEPFRAGRWWWEDEEHKECGLHRVDGRLVRPPANYEKGGGI